MLLPPLPWDRPRRGGDGPRVVLLHGLWRSCRSMEPLARRLREAGFETLNLPYPSTRRCIEDLAARLRPAIQRFAAAGPLHFVAHSLGGIVLRALLAQNPGLPPGRIVLLAPPNRGSEIIDWALRVPGLRLLPGPAGRQLGTAGLPARLPPFPPSHAVAVIMGRRPAIPFFRPLLNGEHDGIVTVDGGRLDQPHAFAVVDADHTFLQIHPETIRLTRDFIATGAWNPAPNPTPP
jgi:triacylglycerol lipase